MLVRSAIKNIREAEGFDSAIDEIKERASEINSELKQNIIAPLEKEVEIACETFGIDRYENYKGNIKSKGLSSSDRKNYQTWKDNENKRLNSERLKSNL